MKRMTLILIAALLIAAFPLVSTTTAQDAAPYRLETTLGRGLVRSLAWSPDGQILAVGGALGIWLYQPVPDGIGFEDIGLLTGHTKAVYGLAFSLDGSRIASVSHDKTVRIWDVARQYELLTLEGHTDLVVTVSWSAENLVASGSYDGTIQLWNPDTGEALGVLGTHDAWIDEVAFNADGSQLASVGHDGKLRVWDMESRDLAWEALAHDSGAQAVTWAREGDRLVTGGRDGQLAYWDAQTHELIDTMQPHEDVIYDVDAKPGTVLIATASWDGTVRHWIMEPLAEHLHTLVGHMGRVHRATWSPDGERLATLGWDDTVRLWDANGVEIAAQNEHMDTITALAWNDNALVSVTLDGRALIWNVESGDLLDTAAGDSIGPSLSADSPDGSRRAEIDDAGIVRIVDAASGDLIMELPGRANAVAWSPNGSRLAVAVRNGTISIWSEQ